MRVFDSSVTVFLIGNVTIMEYNNLSGVSAYHINAKDTAGNSASRDSQSLDWSERPMKYLTPNPSPGQVNFTFVAVLI